MVVQKQREYHTNQGKPSEPIIRHFAQLRRVEQNRCCADKSGAGPGTKEVSYINMPDIVAWANKQKFGIEFGIVCLFGSSILKHG